MTLPPLRLLLTAAGCPGASTLIRMLKANGEREITIHGVDMRAEAVGRFLCDGFEVVPPGGSPAFVPALLEIVRRERPDVVLVQSSDEVEAVARARGTFADLGARALVAAPDAVAVCNDKAAMHAALRDTPVLQPRSLVPESIDEFVAGVHEPAAEGDCGLPVDRPREGEQAACRQRRELEAKVPEGVGVGQRDQPARAEQQPPRLALALGGAPDGGDTGHSRRAQLHR